MPLSEAIQAGLEEYSFLMPKHKSLLGAIMVEARAGPSLSDVKCGCCMPPLSRYDPYVENKKFDEARRRREDERDELLTCKVASCVVSLHNRCQGVTEGMTGTTETAGAAWPHNEHRKWKLSLSSLCDRFYVVLRTRKQRQG